MTLGRASDSGRRPHFLRVFLLLQYSLSVKICWLCTCGTSAGVTNRHLFCPCQRHNKHSQGAESRLHPRTDHLHSSYIVCKQTAVELHRSCPKIMGARRCSVMREGHAHRTRTGHELRPLTSEEKRTLEERWRKEQQLAQRPSGSGCSKTVKTRSTAENSRLPTHLSTHLPTHHSLCGYRVPSARFNQRPQPI